MRKLTVMLALAGAVVFTATACARQGGAESGPGAAAADSITGTVRQVGSTPFVRTIVEGEERSMTVAGPLEDEISRASGARVRVWGSTADTEDPRGPYLRVSGYDILSVDGAEPAVGVLRHESGRGYYLVTESGEEISLSGVPERLADSVGAKIWVIRGETGGVQRYGILRPS